MRRDYLIAFLLFLASIGAGNAVNAAADYFPWLHAHPGWNLALSVGATGALLLAAFITAIRGEQKAEKEGKGLPRLIFGVVIAIMITIAGFSAWYFWPRTNIPVMAVNCSPSSLPPIVPPNGLNFGDFVYPSSATGVGSGGRPGSLTKWPSDRISMPMYCELTIHDNTELYDLTFKLHVFFHEVYKRADGSIENDPLVGERDYPIAIGRINDNLSFGFYAFTTGESMVYATFPNTVKYTDGRSDELKDARLLTINWKALSFAPASALRPNGRR
ncbi:MAG: hypothetical protein ABSF67_15120 [Roseiarcus sp.]